MSPCDPGFQLDQSGKCVPIGSTGAFSLYIAAAILAGMFLIAWWLGK